jgi:hypothetical protein
MTGDAGLSKTSGIGILPAGSMHLVAKVAKAAAAAESDITSVTPRGMAAPPPARPTLHLDLDPSRPATIRIEAAPRLLSARRRDLERELDRAPAAAAASPASLMPQLNWLLLAQGLLLNAFVMLLVFGWSSPLPGRHLLLAGFGLAGMALASVAYLVVSAARARQGGVESGPGQFALRALPVTFVLGWAALSLYAIALPS